MGRLRSALKLAPLLAVLALLTVGQATPAGAMVGGQRVAALPWNALIISNTFFGLEEDPLCSGEVVGDGWVLTAAHCVVKNGQTVSPSSLRVLVGRDDRNNTSEGAAYGIAQIVTMPGFQNKTRDDAALIQLQGFDSSRWDALPLAFESSVINNQSGVTFFGYGDYGWNVLGQPTGAGLLWKSPDGAFVRQPSCDSSGFACFARTTNAVRIMPGDSGGAWVRWAGGAWQLIAVEDVVNGTAQNQVGDPAGGTSTLAKLPDGRTMLQWVRNTVGIPSAAPGTIVRDPATGNSWLIASDDYRNWIANGGTYLCLTGQGHIVVNLPQITIDTVPDRVGVHATCSNPASSGSGAGSPGGGGTGSGSTGGGVGAGSTGSIQIGWSSAHPTWISMTLNGFPAGVYSYTCSFGSGGDHTYTLNETSEPQTFDNGATCYDAQAGDTVWVTIGSVQSNILTVTGTTTPPPPPPTLYAETTGGVSHTWTDYSDAGGNEGPSIGSNQTVQIACKASGWKAPDGNTWWYRIAQSPWNNQYYVSADAFYNNGATSGSLIGTPFYDPNVPTC